MSRLRCIVDGTEGPLVRRKILVFRRLEPGDVRAPGARPMPESPYVEARVLDVALSKSTHDDMVRVAQKRAEMLDVGHNLLHRFELPGIVLTAAASGWLGTYLDYFPRSFRTGFAVAFVIGVVLAYVTRSLRKAAEEAARTRWAATPESKEYERLAKELAAGWERYVSTMKREHDGFHAELRVSEGSGAPERLCSIDPRPFAQQPPQFDPEDWLPTVGGGVRYEVVDAMGDIVTRALEGVDDVLEEEGEGGAKAKATEKKASEGEKVAPDEAAKASGEDDDGEPAKGAADAGAQRAAVASDEDDEDEDERGEAADAAPAAKRAEASEAGVNDEGEPETDLSGPRPKSPSTGD